MTKSTKKKTFQGFSDEERAAMKERAQELLASKGVSKGDGEKMLLAKIAEMPEPDRTLCKKLHAIVRANAPSLSPKTWYGMPAYANKDGKVVCFFRGAYKFKERYLLLGFENSAKLDDGNMWPVVFAVKKLTDAEEKKITALVKKAVG